METTIAWSEVVYKEYKQDSTFVGFHSSKDSIKSLLQSNGLNLKSWFGKLDIDIDYSKDALIKYEQKLSDAAEDYLIILIQ